MPYCPKCGVELDTKIKNCPLCQYPMPTLLDETKNRVVESKFPQPENIYWDTLVKIKNQIFFTLSILFVSALLVLLSMDSYVHFQNRAIRYSIISIICGWIYLFFLFGYVKNTYLSVLGIGITTLILTFRLDSFDGILSWSWDYALPIVIVSVCITLLFITFYKKSKHKNQYVFIPAYLCIVGAIFFIALEIIFDVQAKRAIRPSWSMIAFIVLSSIATVLFGLYYKLPDKIKHKIKRRLHI